MSEDSKYVEALEDKDKIRNWLPESEEISVSEAKAYIEELSKCIEEIESRDGVTPAPPPIYISDETHEEIPEYINNESITACAIGSPRADKDKFATLDVTIMGHSVELPLVKRMMIWMEECVDYYEGKS